MISLLGMTCMVVSSHKDEVGTKIDKIAVYGPSIFILCREWSARIKALPAEELSVAIKAFLSDLYHLMDQQVEQLQKKEKSVDANNGESKSKDGVNTLIDGDTNDDVSSNLCRIQTSLIRVLDKLNKFSEASLKMYEDVR